MMKTGKPRSLLVWILQTGEPLHIDGGLARPMRAMNLSNTLVGAGHRVVLWSSAFYHQEKRHRSTSARYIKVTENLEIRLIPSRGYRRHIGFSRLIDHAQLAFNLKKMLKDAGPLPDVAFIGYPPIEAAAILARWLAKCRVPVLLDVKDQWPSLFLDVMPRPFRHLGRIVLSPYFSMARQAMHDATGLCAMANGFLEWSLGFAGRERTDLDGVFPLTAPVGQVSDAQLHEARLWWDGQGIANDRSARFCFVGSHSPAFDFNPVQEAARITSNGGSRCDFVICGDGASTTALRAMMAGLSNVHFPGWIDRPKMEALAERCLGALAPYVNSDDFRMSLPNKIVDALSLGLPILSPLQGEVAKLISDHRVGLGYGTDTGKTLNDCILALTQDTTLQRSMSENARTIYAKFFSFEMVYGGLVRHIERVANLGAADVMR